MTVYKLQRDILYGPVLPVFVTVRYVCIKTYVLRVKLIPYLPFLVY